MKRLIPKPDIPLYRPGTIYCIAKDSLYFYAAALSDDRDDVILSKRKYADQGKALDFAENWFEDNKP
jgi:hypothetical protein